MEILLLFFVGMCLGSFLGVVIDRLPKNKPILIGRSQCEACLHVLSWYDLIPVVSYLLLKGRCRYCHKKFSFSYPLFEVFIGCFLVSLSILLGPINSPSSLLSFCLEVVVFLSFVALTFIDIKEGILPDKIILFATIITFVFLVVSGVLIVPHIIAGIGAFFFFFMIVLLTRGKGMGMGDVKLAFLLGLFLGWPAILIAIYIAFLTGAIIGIILIIQGKKKFHGGLIAFGPFLIFGTFLAFFWGKTVWEMIIRLMGI